MPDHLESLNSLFEGRPQIGVTFKSHCDKLSLHKEPIKNVSRFAATLLDSKWVICFQLQIQWLSDPLISACSDYLLRSVAQKCTSST